MTTIKKVVCATTTEPACSGAHALQLESNVHAAMKTECSQKKKTVYYAHTSQEKEYMSHDRGAQGMHQGQSLGRRSGELWVRACIVVSARKKGGAG